MTQTLTRLDDILDQRPAVGWLRAAWDQQRLPHALLLAGPVGVGKATTARALAALFLCHKPTGTSPCGKCESCRAMRGAVHPDFTVVYRQLVRIEKGTAKARDLAVDVVRQFLIAPANLKPALGHGKVFVVEESELMTTQAQNALLKTLEEPLGRVLIILLTSQPDSLLPTIRSRCQLLRFAPLPGTLVQEELARQGCDKRAAAEAALFAGGSLGTALRWLEDGVIDAARELATQLDAIMSSRPPEALPEWLRKSAETYAEKQLSRDPLASKDQATREGLATYFKIASDHLRRRLGGLHEPAEIESTCAAIDAIAQAEQYLDSNVNVPLVIQQCVSALERAFSESLLLDT